MDFKFLTLVIAFFTLCVHSNEASPKRGKRKGRNRSNSRESSIADVGTPLPEETSTPDLSHCPTVQIPTEEPDIAPWDKPPPRFRLKEREKQALKRGCNKKRGGCKSQSEKNRQKKSEFKNAYKKSRRGRGKKEKKKGSENQGVPETTTTGRPTTTTMTEEAEDIETEAIVEAYLEKLQTAKRAILRAQGLADDIEPNDDGVWQGDIALTEEQLDLIIAGAENDESVTQSLRKKRYALYFENSPNLKWDTFPIKYTFNSDFGAQERQIVRRAILDIEFKTCIKFEEVPTQLNTQHILFRKIATHSFCGLSNLGRSDDQNLIWLNFGCSTILGTTTHEILHALGVDHQQTRYDRNNFVKINWDSVDPQSFDIFTQNDVSKFSSYGVKYDYYSIMHYNGFVGALDNLTASMQPIKKPDFFQNILGQRVAMSDRDAELLRKMYCSPDCEDTNPWCGWWATDGYCEKDAYVESMAKKCPKSCGMCPGSAISAPKSLLPS